MVYEYEINGIPVQTGDLICTTDGGPDNMKGQFWRFIGKLIPGDVDHIVIYVGPEGRCVEAGAKGRVISFTFYVLDRSDVVRFKPSQDILDFVEQHYKR